MPVSQPAQLKSTLCSVWQTVNLRTKKQPGNPIPTELGRISVFDTATARVYVDKDRKVEFLPYELDLLNKLALAENALDSDFEARAKRIDVAIRTTLPAG